MLKHSGKHNSRKVIVLYRTVPGEDHMALIAYSDSLPSKMHDDIMKILESEVGQQAAEFSDALGRSLLTDGRQALNALHREGFIKKVPTNQVIMTPTSNSTVRLDELNSILTNMALGEDAVKKMAELDSQRGMRGSNSPAKKTVKEGRELGQPEKAPEFDLPTLNADGVLDDNALATTWNAQATKMRNEAKSLLAEADRLNSEASALLPKAVTKKAIPKAVKVAKAAKVATKITTAKKTNAKATKKTTHKED